MLRKTTVALAVALMLGGAFITTDAFAAEEHPGGGHPGYVGGRGHGGGGYGGAYGGYYGPAYGFGGCLPVPVPIVGCW